MILHSTYFHRVYQCLIFPNPEVFKYPLGYPTVQIIQGFLSLTPTNSSQQQSYILAFSYFCKRHDFSVWNNILLVYFSTRLNFCLCLFLVVSVCCFYDLPLLNAVQRFQFGLGILELVSLHSAEQWCQKYWYQEKMV